MQQVNDLMSQYSQAITKLKNLKANFGLKSRVTNELKCQRKEVESDLEDIRHSRFDPLYNYVKYVILENKVDYFTCPTYVLVF